MKIRMVVGISQLIAAFLLSGCAFHPDIVSARAHRIGSDEIVEISLHARDAAKIEKNQIYFSMVVMECDGGKSRFPAEPYASGQRASDFNFATTNSYVKFTGSMPAIIFMKYSNPCVQLEGGSYFFYKLIPTPIKILETK